MGCNHGKVSQPSAHRAQIGKEDAVKSPLLLGSEDVHFQTKQASSQHASAMDLQYPNDASHPTAGRADHIEEEFCGEPADPSLREQESKELASPHLAAGDLRNLGADAPAECAGKPVVDNRKCSPQHVPDDPNQPVQHQVELHRAVECAQQDCSKNLEPARTSLQRIPGAAIATVEDVRRAGEAAAERIKTPSQAACANTVPRREKQYMCC